MNSVTVESLYDHDPDADQMARLPGEELGDAAPVRIGEPMVGEGTESLRADQRTAGSRAAGGKPRKNNVSLYAGVGLVALLMAGGYVFFRPAISNHPVQATQGTVRPSGQTSSAITLLAPSAALAKVPVPRLPPAVVHQKYVPQPASLELSELLSLHSAAPTPVPPIPKPQAPPAGGAIPVQHAPAPPAPARLHAPAAVVMPEPRHGAMGGALTVAIPAIAHVPATGIATAPAPQASPSIAAKTQGQSAALAAPAAPGVKPGNPSAVLAGVHAAFNASPPGPSSPAQQTSLYQLLTQLGVLVRDDEVKQAVLAAQVQQLTLLTSGKMADLDRRLSILEAQTAVSGAVQAASNAGVPAVISAMPPAAPGTAAPAGAPAGAAAAAAATVAVSTGALPAPSSSTLPAPAMPAAPSPSGPVTTVQYQVQAASPGLAMLSPIGGSGSPLEVQTGDIIPGYGRVLGVVQQGDAWVVQTQSGNIQ
jgi:hypothetical protein